MSPSDRQQLHASRLAQIAQVQVVSGRGDQARLDHEATLLERARLLCEELASFDSTERGLAAFDRLLHIAGDPAEPHARQVREFLEAVWNQKPLSLRALRGVGGSVGDDMLAVLDAYRFARLSLPEHVEGGARRVDRVLRSRGVQA